MCHFLCQEVSPTEPEQCVALYLCQLQCWADSNADSRGLPLMRGVPLNNMIIWAKKNQRSCGIQLQRFCTLVLVTKSDKGIINPSYLCSIAVLALGGSSLSPDATNSLNVFTEGKTGLGLRGQPLHVTEEAVTWEEEVKCAGQRGWVGKQ